jgi:ATP-dependent protease HslVU (ClpYQ) peptidase subunit
MNKLLKLAFVGAVALSLTTTVASANATKGQKLYSKKLKSHCGFSGAVMAAKHSQDEWEEIQSEGKLNDEIKKQCGTTTKDKYLPHLYDFFYKFANDSGNVPSC